MRVVEDIDILTDQDRQRVVALASLVVLVVGIVVFVALAITGAGDAHGGLATALFLVVGYLVCLPLHELTHAAFFKLLGPAQTHITFGYSTGMLYAGCPGTRFSRRAFIAILLAPLVLISLLCIVFGALIHDPLIAWGLFMLHASGCSGDVYFVWCIMKNPQATLCEDTNKGMRLLADDQ